ncbi:metallophosphoesterase [Desulfosediminicola flagellatus]|uniref:metallophosphoesterase n=1 Tax=Desulfosediminicola flagellatus TaxID=2569541 RepID=UPI0010AC0381|nr:metallophosphoesterase [Desulfosediminicola flagellatus]
MMLPEFDEIHVVSDLHMGGEGSFQILRETERLAAFISWVKEQRPSERVALILNGDIIDTLAEKGEDYIAIDTAEKIVTRIMEDPSFSSVWAALSDFVKTDGRFLVITLGNHDLELSYPVVQRIITQRLAGNHLESCARIEFSTMGAGYSCMVGNSRVFCTHGNEVDSWNYTRYEDLAKVARRLNVDRNLKSGEWEPNAGTMMVKDVMNDVKRKYPWIDLLKPEKNAAVGVLLALDPGQVKKIGRLLPIIGEKVEGNKEVDQRLSAEGYSVPPADKHITSSVYDLLGENLTQAVFHSDKNTAYSDDALLLEVENEFETGSAVTDHHDETLGVMSDTFDRLKALFSKLSKGELLRRSLQDWLKDDQTFTVDNQDETYKEIVSSVGIGVNFIVTGHTHLERAIEVDKNRFYFNCGTWIRLLRLTNEMLKSEASFKPVLEVFEKGTMEAIDKATFDKKPFVIDQNSAVCIGKHGNHVIGQLVHVEYTGNTVTPRVIQQFQR